MTARKADLGVSRFFTQGWWPVETARFLMRGGYLGLAAGRRPRLRQPGGVRADPDGHAPDAPCAHTPRSDLRR